MLTGGAGWSMPMPPRAMVATPYLELQRVVAWQGPRPVLQGLDLQLNLGEHTVVLGPNGSGKSALIKLLSRELYPVVEPGSSLRLFGSATVNLWELRRRIGHVSADLQATYRPQTAAEEVVLSGWFGSVGIGRHHQASAMQRERAQELLERMGLAGLERRPLGELSDGQRRRVLLARALVHQPELLVLDEPTNGLDPQARHLLLGILRQLAGSGTTLLLVTHQLEAVIPEVSRAVLLKGGRLEADGSVEELLRSEPLSRLFETPLQVVQQGGWRQLLPA